jgi:hypothetical protein
LRIITKDIFEQFRNQIKNFQKEKEDMQESYLLIKKQYKSLKKANLILQKDIQDLSH